MTTEISDEKKAELDSYMDEVVKEAEASRKLAAEILEKDPSLGFMSAIIIANDIKSGERSDRFMREEGMPYSKACMLVGSYARLDFAVRAQQDGYLSKSSLLRALPDLWSMSDPDDTDPRFIKLWREARAKRGAVIYDKTPLPSQKIYDVYRGQDEGANVGIAWSLDLKIAEKFANGAGLRQSNRGGTILHMQVERKDILAYLTGRGESECIIDTSGSWK